MSGEFLDRVCSVAPSLLWAISRTFNRRDGVLRGNRSLRVAILNWKCALGLGLLAGPLCDHVQATPVQAQVKRDAVNELSKALVANYVLDDVAREMVAKIKDRLSAGAYDKYSEPNAFAKALTEDLRAVYMDRHLV